MNLQKEAENHKEEYSFFTPETQNQKRLSFIAGATSKYVEQEKLKEKIEVYSNLLNQCDNHKAAICVYMIKQKNLLEQQLKELEDE